MCLGSGYVPFSNLVPSSLVDFNDSATHLCPSLQINASSSPYEAEDDFFRSQDDLSSVLSKRASRADLNARPRGQSEGCSRSS